VLHQGIASQLGVSIGTITIAVSPVVLLAWVPLREMPWLGTLSNALVAGLATNLGLPFLHEPRPLDGRTALMALGIAGNAVATAMYIGARLGPGPRDGLMTGLHRRTGRPIWVVRTSLGPHGALATEDTQARCGSRRQRVSAYSGSCDPSRLTRKNKNHVSGAPTLSAAMPITNCPIAMPMPEKQHAERRQHRDGKPPTTTVGGRTERRRAQQPEPPDDYHRNRDKHVAKGTVHTELLTFDYCGRRLRCQPSSLFHSR
jgi:hypothetical protein